MNHILTTFLEALEQGFIESDVYLDADKKLQFYCNCDTKLDCDDCPHGSNCASTDRSILQDLITQHYPELLI